MNEVFIDSNVFISSLTEEPARGKLATQLLDSDHEFCTSILNLMEIRSVMMKRKRVEQDAVEDVLADIYNSIDIYAPEISDQIAAYQLQEETVLYTLDCLLLALATDLGATMGSFDAELCDHGAVSPDELI